MTPIWSIRLLISHSNNRNTHANIQILVINNLRETYQIPGEGIFVQSIWGPFTCDVSDHRGSSKWNVENSHSTEKHAFKRKNISIFVTIILKCATNCMFLVLFSYILGEGICWQIWQRWERGFLQVLRHGKWNGQAGHCPGNFCWLG